MDVDREALQDVLSAHLDGGQRKLSQGDIVRRVNRRFTDHGWAISAPGLSRLKTGATRTTDWQKLLAIAWALDLDRREADRLLAAANHPDLAELYRFRSRPAEDIFFEPWPEPAAAPAPETTTPPPEPTVQAPEPTTPTSPETRRPGQTTPASGRPWRRLVLVGAAATAATGIGVAALRASDLGEQAAPEPPGASTSDQTTTTEVEPDGPTAVPEPARIEATASFVPVSPLELTAVSFSPDGSEVAVAGDAGEITFWNPETGQAIGDPLLGHNGPIKDLTYSPDGSLLVTGGEDGLVGLWDVRTRTNTAMLPGHVGRVRAVDISPDGSQLASVGLDGTLRRWDPLSGEPIGDPTIASPGETIAVAYSPDGTEIATTGEGFEIMFWDPTTGGRKRDSIAAFKDWVRDVVYRPDGGQLAAAGRDTTVRLFDDHSSLVLDGHTDRLHVVTYRKDGTLLASAGDDRRVRFWNPETGQPLGDPHPGHGESIKSAAFSPDGTILATVAANGELGLWRISTEH